MTKTKRPMKAEKIKVACAHCDVVVLSHVLHYGDEAELNTLLAHLDMHHPEAAQSLMTGSGTDSDPYFVDVDAMVRDHFYCGTRPTTADEVLRETAAHTGQTARALGKVVTRRTMTATQVEAR